MLVFPSSFDLSPHRVEQEAVMKQKQEEEKLRQKAHRHAGAIQHQVKERELSAIAKRRETFQEGHQLTEKHLQRRVRLGEMKEKKLKELR